MSLCRTYVIINSATMASLCVYIEIRKIIKSYGFSIIYWKWILIIVYGMSNNL